MAKQNLKDYQYKIVTKIKQDVNQLELFITECNKRGLSPRKVIERAEVAASTMDNWKKNPIQFDNLASMYRTLDEMAEEMIKKLKTK